MPPRKRKSILRIWGTTLAFVALAVFSAYLYANRYWPFSTNTDNPAFLGTTFGMSIQEVRRALHKAGAELLTYEQYKRVDQHGLIRNDVLDIVPFYFEDQNQYVSYVMPSINLFETTAEAEFTFCQQRLDSVSVYFGCYGLSNALAVVETLKSHLLNVYQLAEREDSEDVPGAFSLNFISEGSQASLWVNVSDANEQQVNLTLTSSDAQNEKQKKLREREKKVLSTPKL